MSLLSEPDVMQFRRGYYELLTRLFASEPDAELLRALREGSEERAVGATQVHPAMGEGWRAIGAHAHRDDLEALVDEFTRLFLGPVGRVLNPFESFYLTGRPYSQPLADVRAFMARHSVEPARESGEPEDALALELGIMALLVARQQAAGDADPESLLQAQREFLGAHLLVWVPACMADLEAHPGAAFYRGAAQVLRGFLDVERDFFSEDAELQVESLEDARRRYHAPEFRGPVFDPEAPPAGGPAHAGKDKDDA
jgi:TorA maturation chaperone TorD